MAEVVLYTKSTCPYSQAAMELLREKGVKFTNHDIEAEPGARTEMMERTGGRHTVPQIFIDGRHIGGCDDLMALEERGALDSLLGE